jgi:hypothetical protein
MDRNRACPRTEFVVNRGKIIILLILTVAVGISVYGVWFRHRQMRRVLESFSPPVAQMIGYAPDVELLLLGPAGSSAAGEVKDSNGKRVKIGQDEYPITATRNVIAVKGFSKLRADLVRDSNYQWADPPDAVIVKVAPVWEYVLVLTDDQEQVRLAFSPNSCQMMLLDSGPILSIAPICEATKELLAEQFSKSTR